MTPRKWFWDFDYFSKRTPEVAYWAGFMMADGNISSSGKTSYTLTFGVSEKDLEHLHIFCDSIGLDREAIYKTESKGGGIIEGRTVDGSLDFYYITLNHKSLLDQLYYWGIIQRKSYQFETPKVSLELLPHYLRGWVDGDGYVYAKGRGARFSVCGNPMSMAWFIQALKRLGYTGNISKSDRSETTSIIYAGGTNQVSEIINLLKVNTSSLKLGRRWNTEYVDDRKMIVRNCEQCGKLFDVPQFRDKHPTHGRFCSKECFDEYQKKPIVDGKRECARCKEWISLEDFSANDSYCKTCWREYNAERRRKVGIKKQKRIETKIVDGIIMRKCARCGEWFPKKSSAYCRSCHTEYTRERRAQK